MMNNDPNNQRFDGRVAAAWAAGAAAAGFAALAVLLLLAFFGSSRPAQVRGLLAGGTEAEAGTSAHPAVKTDGTTAAEASVYAAVLRLHILANSDSERDQAIKLAVRDAVVGLVGDLVRDCENRDEAAETVGMSEETVLGVVLSILRSEGAEYGATMAVGPEEYPEREYGGEIYPAGEYLSVRIVLGEGKGRNWWCVLFPRLCLAPALTAAPPEPTLPSVPGGTGESVPAGLTPEEYRRVTETTDVPKFRVRFRLFELLREWIEG